MVLVGCQQIYMKHLHLKILYKQNNNLNNLSTRQFNKITAVSNVVTQEVQNQENSVWGLFNGILKSTEQFTPKNAQKEDFYMAGQGYSINMKAYSTIFDYLEKNKAI